MNLVNCKASKPSNEPKKKKNGEGVFLHWCAMHSGKFAHTHFQMLSKPQEHTERSTVCLTLIILLQKNKKELFQKKQTNSCPFCNSLLTFTCQTRGSHPPQYKRHQVLPTLKWPVWQQGWQAQSCFFGALLATPLPPASSLFSDSPLNSWNRDRFLLSHWAQSLDKVLSSCLPSSLSFKYLKKIVFF